MITLTVSGEARTLAAPLTVAKLLEQLGYDRRRVAVEVNRDVVPGPNHGERLLNADDAVEIVTLVGGGAPEAPPAHKPLVIGRCPFTSRRSTRTGQHRPCA